jgi:hypothetical protein
MITGIIRYKRLNTAMRVLAILLCTISFFEMTTYILYKTGHYKIRATVNHISSVAEIILISRYFLELIRPVHYAKLIIASYIIWPVIAMLNAAFLQPVTKLNTNMLVFESFAVITLCLNSIYTTLKKNIDENIFYHPHFWISVLWLLLWSSTFFLFAFLKVLYGNKWPYLDVVLTFQVIVNIIVYSGITAVLFFYPKKTASIEHR